MNNQKADSIRASLGLEGSVTIKSHKDKRVRHGKTSRDHKSGTHARNGNNKVLRGEYMKDNKAREADFPLHTLGGKGNSSVAFKVVSGKGRTQL